MEFNSAFDKGEDARAEELKAEIALGIHEVLRGGGEPFLHDAASCVGCGNAKCRKPPVRVAVRSACMILGVRREDIIPHDKNSALGRAIQKKTLELICSARRKLIY